MRVPSADYAHEHIDPGIRMSHSTVMLSPFVALRVNSAKHLAAHRDRPFASLRVTVEGPNSSSILFFEKFIIGSSFGWAQTSVYAKLKGARVHVSGSPSTLVKRACLMQGDILKCLIADEIPKFGDFDTISLSPLLPLPAG